MRETLLVLSCLLAVAGASSIVDVYRLLQADISGGSIGSQHYSAKGVRHRTHQIAAAEAAPLRATALTTFTLDL